VRNVICNRAGNAIVMQRMSRYINTKKMLISNIVRYLFLRASVPWVGQGASADMEVSVGKAPKRGSKTVE
jgi:hypothetical protein